MKIRQATRFDIPALVSMMKHYRDHSPLPCLLKSNNESHVEQMLNEIIVGRGIIYVADHFGTVVGMLIAMRNPNLWDPKILAMNELAYWVEPEQRNTSAGYKLLSAYRDYCEEQKTAGLIEYYTISKMINSPDIRYDRFGFNKLEEMWSS